MANQFKKLKIEFKTLYKKITSLYQASYFYN